MNFDHEELLLMMLYNTGTRLGLVHELRLMQCYLMPDETALRELSEGVIEKLKLLTDAEFAELEFPPNLSFAACGRRTYSLLLRKFFHNPQESGLDRILPFMLY